MDGRPYERAAGWEHWRAFCLNWCSVQVDYDDPDAAKLIAEVQQEYVIRYGGEDTTPMNAAQFAPPQGLFVVGYQGERPSLRGVAGPRRPGPDFADGDAEVKRMYVADPPVAAGSRG